MAFTLSHPSFSACAMCRMGISALLLQLRRVTADDAAAFGQCRFAEGEGAWCLQWW
jgi:hypothetical protein